MILKALCSGWIGSRSDHDELKFGTESKVDIFNFHLADTGIDVRISSVENNLCCVR